MCISSSITSHDCNWWRHEETERSVWYCIIACIWWRNNELYTYVFLLLFTRQFESNCLVKKKTKKLSKVFQLFFFLRLLPVSHTQRFLMFRRGTSRTDGPHAGDVQLFAPATRWIFMWINRRGEKKKEKSDWGILLQQHFFRRNCYFPRTKKKKKERQKQSSLELQSDGRRMSPTWKRRYIGV